MLTGLEFWREYAWDCRTLTDLYAYEPLRLPVRKRFVGIFTKKSFEALSLCAGPGCFLPVLEPGQRAYAIGTTENLDLLKQAPIRSLPRFAGQIVDIYGELFYRLHPEALQEMRDNHAKRYQENRVRHKVAELYPEFRIGPDDPDWDPNSKQEVQLRPLAGSRRLGGLN